MRQKFTINTEPHVAELGDVNLLFQPEVNSDEFAESWAEMQSVYSKVEKDPKKTTADDLRQGTEAARNFLRSFMLEESQEDFDNLKIPDRILIQMMEWVAEIYGRRPTGSSSASVQPPSKTGPRSTDRSRSKR